MASIVDENHATDRDPAQPRRGGGDARVERAACDRRSGGQNSSTVTVAGFSSSKE